MAAKEAAKDSRVREFFHLIGGRFDISKLPATDAPKIRPFVSPLAWAYYSAYRSIVTHAVLKVKALEAGVEKDFIDTEAVTKLVKVALPHQEAYIEKYGTSAFHYLLEELEANILTEINNILQGQQSDKETVAKAALILKESDRLTEANAASNQST